MRLDWRSSIVVDRHVVDYLFDWRLACLLDFGFPLKFIDEYFKINLYEISLKKLVTFVSLIELLRRVAEPSLITTPLLLTEAVFDDDDEDDTVAFLKLSYALFNAYVLFVLPDVTAGACIPPEMAASSCGLATRLSRLDDFCVTLLTCDASLPVKLLVLTSLPLLLVLFVFEMFIIFIAVQTKGILYLPRRSQN